MRRYDQVPRKSKYPLLTGHTRRSPVAEIRYTGLIVYGNESVKSSTKHHSAYGPVIICNCKQGYYSDRRICKMMTLNEIHYNPEWNLILTSKCRIFGNKAVTFYIYVCCFEVITFFTDSASDQICLIVHKNWCVIVMLKSVKFLSFFPFLLDVAKYMSTCIYQRYLNDEK
jgi:hypothetical protein